MTPTVKFNLVTYAQGDVFVKSQTKLNESFLNYAKKTTYFIYRKRILIKKMI